MSQTETIRFALKDYKFREVSKGKGLVDYHLVDMHGNQRTVSAMANLNWRKQVCSVKPIHHREMPLIDALAKAKLNETIEVDFSEFNKKYPRGSIRSKKMKVHSVKVSKHDAQCISSIGSLMDHKMRVIQLVAFSVASVAAAMLVMNQM
jgi:hypothetical protein